MPVGHILIKAPSGDFEKVLEFYLAALKPLGYQKLVNLGPSVVGLGAKAPDWFIMSSDAAATSNLHVAFVGEDRAAVDEFHAAGLAAGGKDNGLPGVRENISPTYYAAFLIDPLGNNIEVV
ncbi:glyoxalase family protein, partial [Thozetella sp. PMI_491]